MLIRGWTARDQIGCDNLNFLNWIVGAMGAGLVAENARARESRGTRERSRSPARIILIGVTIRTYLIVVDWSCTLLMHASLVLQAISTSRIDLCYRRESGDEAALLPDWHTPLPWLPVIIGRHANPPAL